MAFRFEQRDWTIARPQGTRAEAGELATLVSPSGLPSCIRDLTHECRRDRRPGRLSHWSDFRINLPSRKVPVQPLAGQGVVG